MDYCTLNKTSSHSFLTSTSRKCLANFVPDYIKGSGWLGIQYVRQSKVVLVLAFCLCVGICVLTVVVCVLCPFVDTYHLICALSDVVLFVLVLCFYLAPRFSPLVKWHFLLGGKRFQKMSLSYFRSFTLSLSLSLQLNCKGSEMFTHWQRQKTLI